VVDVGFEGQVLPPVDTAMFIEKATGQPILAEVQGHISDTKVRALARSDGISQDGSKTCTSVNSEGNVAAPAEMRLPVGS
jgi:F0F1-type ATP synthase beta subunit